ncbi:MAG: hypothetical protein U9Q76_02865 [candidate division WOR-3 bacterium]|nr:hypothetical protein [candidate division WOR-3 bacterium]
MKRTLNLLLMGIVAAGLVTCGGEDPEPVLKELTQRYWQAVFRGRIQEAYEMLSDSSRASVTPQEFSEAMRFVALDGEGVHELQDAFAGKTKLTILGVEAKKKEGAVTVILLVPALAGLKSNLEAQLASGEIEVEDEAAWMLQEMTTAIEENRLPTQELRLKMTWILENNQWRLVF